MMEAQREEMKQREEKERMEMLEALMGGYQVEELLESAVKAALKKKAAGRKKGGRRGMGSQPSHKWEREIGWQRKRKV